jgi:hypothetical protein
MTDNLKTEWQLVSLPGKEDDVFIEVILRGGREEVGLAEAIPFERINSLLAQIAESMGAALEKAKPTKAVAELGIEFGLEAGKLVALIARGSTKANLKISLEWKRSLTSEQ